MRKIRRSRKRGREDWASLVILLPDTKKKLAKYRTNPHRG